MQWVEEHSKSLRERLLLLQSFLCRLRFASGRWFRFAWFGLPSRLQGSMTEKKESYAVWLPSFVGDGVP